MSLLQNALDATVGADFYSSFERTVVTVNVKQLASQSAISYWIATRLLKDGSINQIFQMQFPHRLPQGVEPQEVEQIVYEACVEIFDSLVKPLLEKAIDSESFVQPMAELSHESRTELAVGHMALHQKIQNLGDEATNLNVRTAREYQIAKSFGLGTAVNAIALFEKVGPTAVTRRLTRTRDAGLIGKSLKTTDGRAQRKESK